MSRIPGLSRATLRLSRAPLAALASIGVIWGALVASLPDIKARIGAGDAELGVAILSSSISAFLAMALAPWIVERSRADVLLIVMLVMAVSAVPLGLVTSIATFALAMGFAGITTGLTDMIGNGRIAELEAQHDAALMNLNHACFSFAYAIAAMLTGIARETGLAPQVWFALIGGVILCLTFAGRDTAAVDAAPKGIARSVRGPVGLHAWLAGGVVLVAFFVENSTEVWAALHIERTLGGGAAEGAFGPAMLGLTMGTGRLLGHLVTARGQEPRVLAIAAWMSGAGLLIAAIAPVPGVAYLGFGLVGLGASVIAPLALALAGQAADPGRRTMAVSRAMLLGYMGFVIGPPLLGVVSDGFGLRAAFAVAALAVIAVPLILLPRMRRLAA